MSRLPNKADRLGVGSGARKARIAQFAVSQSVLALLLLVFAFVTRAQRRTSVLSLWTILIPAGFVLVYGNAFQRQEAAMKRGAWSAEMSKAETRRGYSLLGFVFLTWILGILAIFFLV